MIQKRQESCLSVTTEIDAMNRKWREETDKSKINDDLNSKVSVINRTSRPKKKRKKRERRKKEQLIRIHTI